MEKNVLPKTVDVLKEIFKTAMSTNYSKLKNALLPPLPPWVEKDDLLKISVLYRHMTLACL